LIHFYKRYMKVRKPERFENHFCFLKVDTM